MEANSSSETYSSPIAPPYTTIAGPKIDAQLTLPPAVASSTTDLNFTKVDVSQGTVSSTAVDANEQPKQRPKKQVESASGSEPTFSRPLKASGTCVGVKTSSEDATLRQSAYKDPSAPEAKKKKKVKLISPLQLSHLYSPN